MTLARIALVAGLLTLVTPAAAGSTAQEDANKKTVKEKPSFLPKAWKAGPEVSEPVAVAAPEPTPNVVHQVQQNVREVTHEIPVDDLDVPTFLRRQAQKA